MRDVIFHRLSLGKCGFEVDHVNSRTVPVSTAVLAWQQEGAGCIGPSDTVPTSLCMGECQIIVPGRQRRTKPREPTQLEMARSIHAECSACSGTFLPCVSKETTSYSPSCFWQETSSSLIVDYMQVLSKTIPRLSHNGPLYFHSYLLVTFLKAGLWRKKTKRDGFHWQVVCWLRMNQE